MNCRARADELARRLQSRVKVGTGGTTQTLEHTSLVSPTLEGPYSSMECRHSSLDDPNFNLDDHDLRPIHVVTSEPTLHIRLPSPPSLNKAVEQDSDVYYDFDLVSPDDAADEEEQEQEEEKRRSSFVSSERPESGCVTSVTSPLMFDNEGDEDVEGDENHLGVSRDLYAPQESVVFSPADADLRAVRHILSSTSLNDKQTPPRVPRDDLDTYKRFSSTDTDGDKDKSDSDDKGINGDNVGEISECDKISDSVSASCECQSWPPEDEGLWRSGDSAFSEGTSDGTGDKWHYHPQQHQQQPCSGQVKMPVANSGTCWCHTAGGSEPVRHLPATVAPETYSARADPRYSEYSEVVLDSSACTYDVPVMTDDEAKERIQERTDEGEKEREVPWRRSVTTSVSPSLIHSEERLDECDLPSLSIEAESHPPPSEEEKQEALTISESSESATTVVPIAISGTTPPLLAETHLYASSEGQPAVMEARGGSEGDLHSNDEVFCADFDDEVIETLDDEAEGSDDEEEENEEDIEEEVILTGKFRNITGYTERVRRLSDELEDRPPPPVIITPEVEDDLEALEPAKSIDLADEDEQISTSDLASQLSKLDVEDVDAEVGDTDSENTPCESRSSSEEADPARIEDYKMRIKRSSSLKCGKTPPGTPGRKKIVRFADVLGLDLAAVRTFLKGVPHVPRSAFWDLEVKREATAKAAAAAAPLTAAGIPTCVVRRVLTPLFQQPGCHPDFIDRVRHQKVVIENVVIGEDLSVRGVIRVLSLDEHKSVSVRYTFDQWRNFHEATATYVPNSHDGATDRFSFLLWGSFLQDNGALVFCVRYSTQGQEFWDNNYGRNYTLQCYSSMALVGGPGTNSPRPQNCSSVQQQIFSQGSQSASGSQAFNSFGSPTTPNDPWATRFF